MKIDWDGPTDPDGLASTALVLLGGGNGCKRAFTESPGTNPGEQARLERLDDALATARPRVPATEQYALKRRVLNGARSGLAKLNAGELPERFTLADHIGLEAVILTGGERPSLIVTDGFVDLNAPDLGEWRIKLSRFEAGIRGVIGSVGRIEVPVAPWFAGTCFLIAEGLVVTNRHVLEGIAKPNGADGWTLNWPDATTIDFTAETDKPGHGGFKVVSVAFAGPDEIRRRIDFAHLDMAVLRVEPLAAGASFPAQVTLATDLAEPAKGANVYLLGFPCEPKLWVFGGKPPQGFETNQVISTLFNSTFGIKRLAPGTISFGPGELPGDPLAWICAHEASTLEGSSGSCVVDLDADGVRVLGLHLGGVSRAQNWAHAIPKLHDKLAAYKARSI